MMDINKIIDNLVSDDFEFYDDLSSSWFNIRKSEDKREQILKKADKLFKNDLTLYTCEKMRAKITKRQCFINQKLNRIECKNCQNKIWKGGNNK
ncbi:MAG TPA: hypothetical protein ENG63_01010 [Candidatus Desulfofervidus auxilii]|uniref:Uncharacterized protein n=1 Tax=Desulfofervidus auxilii TaxID=1621989 RepID=A0A7C0Y5Y1_DESA2|nr:hypothetical protein [Candidatus Desulfofervidus auxilii]